MRHWEMNNQTQIEHVNTNLQNVSDFLETHNAQVVSILDWESSRDARASERFEEQSADVIRFTQAQLDTLSKKVWEKIEHELVQIFKSMWANIDEEKLMAA